MTKEEILKIAQMYDRYYRGGTERGMIDEELAKILEWASKLEKRPTPRQILNVIRKL